MFVLSVKAQKIKLYLTLMASVLVILSVVLLAPVQKETEEQKNVISVGKQIKTTKFKNVATNEDRIAFLNSYGWEVDPNAVKIQEVVIPSEFDAVYEKYNQIQLNEGLNLEKYKGKSVKLYTYLVSNYEYDGSVYANLMVFKETVIGGDISSARQDGFVHGFTKDNKLLT